MEFVCVKNKQPQEIDPYFDEKNVIIFNGTGIADIMLHIIYCVKVLNNTNGKTYLTCNVDLIRYYDIQKFTNILNILSEPQNDSFEMILNELKQRLNIKKMTPDENPMSFCGVIPRFVNAIMNVVIIPKMIIGVTVILS